MKQFILLLFSIFLYQAVSAQIKISNNCLATIESIQNEFETGLKCNHAALLKKYPIIEINNRLYLGMLAKTNDSFHAAALEQQGIIFGAQVGQILSLKWPLDQLNKIEHSSGLSQLQVAHKMAPNLSKVRYDTRVDSVHQGLGLPQSFTGKDVFIGITDWGFDYTHPMFYDTLLETTRIFAAWDQFKTSGPAPLGYDYGTEYNSPETLIAAGADTANIYSFATHGSHVAGIAGGSGAGTVYRGIAFESQFLLTTFLVDESAVLDAWEWMYDIAEAEGKRLVINMSWGLYNMGPLDGTSLLSQAIDNYSDMGVVFVTSAGNNGGVDFHIKKNICKRYVAFSHSIL